MSKIITSDDLTTYKNKTLVPAVAQQVVDAINTWVETRTHRCFGETKTVTERYDWGHRVWLRQQDIDTTSLTLKLGYPNQAQSILPTTGYWVNTFGRVTLLWQQLSATSPSVSYNDYLEATYTYGVAIVPDDLFLAVLSIAATFYNYAVNDQQDIVAATVGTYRLQYSGSVRGVAGSADPAKSTADANWQVIDSYRRQRL
jgi:hypothetical protein